MGEVGQEERNTRRSISRSELLPREPWRYHIYDCQEYKAVNAKESMDLAQAFVSDKFLRFGLFFFIFTDCNILIRTQLQFLQKKGKGWSLTGLVFRLLLKTAFVWRRFL